MPEHRDELAERLHGAGPELAALVAQATQVWSARAGAGGPSGGEASEGPGWRAFEDAFPTFYQFTNRPR